MAVLIVVLVVAVALVLRPSVPATSAVVSKPPELVIDKAALEAAKKASEASTKVTNAIQASAQKIAADAEPVFRASGFLTQTQELILEYNVNFNPEQNGGSTNKFAGILAKNWKIKEMQAYNPKKVTIIFYGNNTRATRSFDPSGKPL